MKRHIPRESPASSSQRTTASFSALPLIKSSGETKLLTTAEISAILLDVHPCRRNCDITAYRSGAGFRLCTDNRNDATKNPEWTLKISADVDQTLEFHSGET